MWVLMPLLLVGMVPSLLHTAQSPLDTDSTFANAQQSANISRQFTFYFICLFVCFFAVFFFLGLTVMGNNFALRLTTTCL